MSCERVNQFKGGNNDRMHRQGLFRIGIIADQANVPGEGFVASLELSQLSSTKYERQSAAIDSLGGSTASLWRNVSWRKSKEPAGVFPPSNPMTGGSVRTAGGNEPGSARAARPRAASAMLFGRLLGKATGKSGALPQQIAPAYSR